MEINTQSLTELNAATARLLGWHRGNPQTFVRVKVAAGEAGFFELEKYYYSEDEVQQCLAEKQDWEEQYWTPTSDLNQAFMVADKLGITHIFFIFPDANQRRDITPKTEGVRYVDTPYFFAAQKLVDASTVPYEQRVGCYLALSLLLTWLNYDLFKQRGWVLFSSDRMLKELHFDHDKRLAVIAALQRAGLINVQPVGEGGLTTNELQLLKWELSAKGRIKDYWNARSVQSSSTVYRLGKEVQPPTLPTFTPHFRVAMREPVKREIKVEALKKNSVVIGTGSTPAEALTRACVVGEAV